MCALSLTLPVFINNLAEKLMEVYPESAQRLVLSLFADDVTILARDRSRDLAATDAPWTVDVVEDWSKDWKINLNASKSEVAFGDNGNNELYVDDHNTKSGFFQNPRTNNK